MTEPHAPRASRFACRAILRESLAADGALDPLLLAHVEQCAFCTARLQARDRLVPFLQQRAELPAAAKARLSDDVHERIVEHAEEGALGRLLAGGMHVPSAGMPSSVPQGSVPPSSVPQSGGDWPERLLESRLARQVVSAPPMVAAASWARVRSSILDQVAGAPQRRSRRHWWIGLLGTAVAAGIVLVVTQQERGAVPTITIRDISSLPAGAAVPSIDFAVIRNGATR